MITGGPTSGPVIHFGPAIPASSLSSGQGGTCMGRKHPSFTVSYQCVVPGSAFKDTEHQDTNRLSYRARTEHVGKRFTCPRCPPCTYSSKSGLTEHVRHIHDNASRYRCETCGKGFSIRSHYYDHLAAHTGVKRYVCSVCLKEFTWKCNMKTHMLQLHPAEIAPE